MNIIHNQISFDYDFDPIGLYEDMSNKLFCTFTTEDELDNILEVIKDKYKIIYNKIFVLYSKSQDEYILTYNVDFGNVSNFLPNTILVHRKKGSNTLYTINALNTLIKELAEYFKSDNSRFQASKFIYYYQDKKFKFKRDNGNLSKFGKEAMKEFIEHPQ